ncbi:MAG: hypothetical protein IJ658_07370 [Kiritimatiellae bacterium]|nr:hypothetical protein [Kiritimatiellia bacterium]
MGLRDQGDGQRRDFEKGVGTARRAPAGAADGQTGGTDSRRLTGESGAVNPEADALGTAMFSGARSAEALLDDRLRARTDERGGIVAFTGTAADYAQKNPKTGEIENPPSLAYVGTGTGGQLQGHGLYASGERAVGEHYADSAAGGFVSMDALGGAFEYDRDQRTLDWIKMPTQPVSQTVEDALVLLGQARGDVRRAIELGLKSEKDAREAYERWADEDFLRASGYNWQAEGAKQAVKWLRANGGSVKSTFAKDRDAYVYEQRMWPGKALEEINLIDYYGAPTDEDLANVRQIWGDLTNLPAEKLDRYIEFMRTQRDTQHGLKSTKWANIFKTGAKNLGIEPAQFAKALYDLGYHGTVYPLNGSATNASVAEKSGKGSTGWRENIGGYNYVAFNDADIEVRHKWRDGEQMYSGARSAAAIFGGTVRVRADGTMDYSLVADSLLRRTRMLQGMPNFQFASERRSLARVAEEAQALIAQDPEGAQDLVERAVSAFGSGQAFVPSDKELAVLYMEEVMREQRVLDAQEALRRVQDGLGDGTLSELDAQAALAQARADQLTFAQALSNAKSAQGRALGANRMMISDDYSFGGVVDEVVRRIRNSKRLGKAAANTPLSTAEAAQIEKLVKRVQDLADAKDAAEAALSEARAKVRALKAANTRLRDAKAERKRGLKAPKSRAEALEAARKSIAKALETGQVDLANYPELWAALNGPVKALADAMLREQVEAGTAGTHILRIQVCGNAQNRHCRRGTGPPAQNRHCRRGTGPPAPDWHCRRGTGPPAPDWHCRRGTGPPAPDWHCRPGTVAPARNRHCRRGTGPTVKKTALSEGFRTDYGPCYRL